MKAIQEEGGFSAARPFQTLLKKEILRFMSVASQTLAAPLVTATLYLLIFGLSLGRHLSIVPGFTYVQFVVPGLVLMGVVNNSFANTASSLFSSRYLGHIVELLVTPITPGQFIMAYTLAAMLRGLLVGGVIFLVSLLFTTMPIDNPVGALVMLALSSFMFAQFGLIAALFATNFDTLSMFTNFLLLPLIYLGGLFYPVTELPQPWSTVSQLNPLFYLIGGFRHAVLGVGDIGLPRAFGVALALSVALFVWAAYLIRSGRKLRT